MKHGIVQNIGKNMLTIIVDNDGTLEQYDVHPKALITLNDRWATLGELQVGDTVSLNGVPPVNSVRATRHE